MPRSRYLFDALYLPQVINEMAAQAVLNNMDRWGRSAGAAGAFNVVMPGPGWHMHLLLLHMLLLRQVCTVCKCMPLSRTIHPV